MKELHLKYRSFGSRFRCAIAVGMTSFASIAADCNQADAAWWSFPLSRKSADDSPSKSNSGFNGTIRKLLKEAKVQEERGDLDKAIALADRAAKVSESTSTFVKPAPDVSPSTTAQYARELRLKKIEQSVKRSKGTLPEAAPAQNDSSESVAKSSNMELETATPKKLVVKKVTETTARPKAGDSTPTGAVAMTGRRKSQSIAPKASEQFPTPGNEAIEIPVASSEVAHKNADRPVASSSPIASTTTEDTLWNDPDQLWDDPDQQIAEATPASNTPEDNEAKDELLADDDTRDAAPIEPALTEDLLTPASPDADPMVLKLRPQYTSNILDEAFRFAETVESGSVDQDETVHSAMMAASDENETNGGSILPVAAEEDPSPARERPGYSGGESRRRKGQEKEVVEMKIDATSSGDFPVEEVTNLRNRLRSAASLEPGVVAPEVIMTSSVNEQRSKSINEGQTTSRVIRLRKRRQPSREPANPEASTTPVANMRQPVIGQASVVQWRPAKESTNAATSETKPMPEFRSPGQSDDLRRSLRDISMTAYEPSPGRDRASATRPARGSIWDNAAAPSNETNLAVHNSSMNGNATGSTSSSMAPLPPPGSDGQPMSGDFSSGWINRNSGSQSGDQSSIAGLSGSDGGDELLRALDQSISDDDKSSSKKKSSIGPVKRLANLLRISESSLWTILSAAGFAVLMCGLWMVRASVHSDDSPESK